MGKRLVDGQHTRTPTSPYGPPRQESVWGSGMYTSHNGYTFTWDSAQGLYRTRIPPPPANPPGEWAFLVFTEGESYDVYNAQQTGTEIWTEHGQDYRNG